MHNISREFILISLFESIEFLKNVDKTLTIFMEIQYEIYTFDRLIDKKYQHDILIMKTEKKETE